MGMTHEERRQFAVIEQEFHRSNRHRIQRIRLWRFQHEGRRQQAIGLVLVAVGLLVMLAALAVSTVVSFGGFLLVLAGAGLADFAGFVTRSSCRVWDRIRTFAKEAPHV